MAEVYGAKAHVLHTFACMAVPISFVGDAVPPCMWYEQALQTVHTLQFALHVSTWFCGRGAHILHETPLKNKHLGLTWCSASEHFWMKQCEDRTNHDSSEICLLLVWNSILWLRFQHCTPSMRTSGTGSCAVKLRRDGLTRGRRFHLFSSQ